MRRPAKRPLSHSRSSPCTRGRTSTLSPGARAGTRVESCCVHTQRWSSRRPDAFTTRTRGASPWPQPVIASSQASAVHASAANAFRAGDIHTGRASHRRAPTCIPLTARVPRKTMSPRTLRLAGNRTTGSRQAAASRLHELVTHLVHGHDERLLEAVSELAAEVRDVRVHGARGHAQLLVHAP